MKLELDAWRVGWTAATIATIAAAGLADRFLVIPSERHALVVTLLVAAAAAGAWWVTRRLDLAWLAAAIAASWPILHGTDRHLLLAGLAPGLLLLFPTRVHERVPRWLVALFGALVAGGIAVYLVSSPVVSATAAIFTFLLVWIRPAVPTEEAIGTMWSTGLLLPGIVLVGLVPVNAATGWFEAPTAQQALYVGIGLLAALVLVSLEVLGVSTLVESDEPAQASAWLAAMVGFGVILGVATAKDLTLLEAGLAVSVVPLSLLAAVAVARIGHERPPWVQASVYAAGPLLALAQMGLV